MTFFSGMGYNLKGLKMGIKTPGLLLLGMTRFAAVVIPAIFAAGLLLVHHEQILNMIWVKPESLWILWAWQIVAWLLTLLLVGLAVILSYLLAQILFSVVIMDYMSLMTERIITGTEQKPAQASLPRRFWFLIRQEIPRSVLPLLLMLAILVAGWLTPLAPVLTVLSAGVSAIFLAWDSTDLMPARQMVPFGRRFAQLLKSFWFHLGFGILFLVPGLNILLLSFAPVGATLYQIDKARSGGQIPVPVNPELK
jgi:CysZ protein